MKSVRLKVVEYQGEACHETKSFIASSPITTIGRATKCDWALPDPEKFLSGHHCSILISDTDVQLEDRSSNGILFNGSPLPLKQNAKVKLQDSDMIQMGEYAIVVSFISPASYDETVKASPNEFPYSIEGLISEQPKNSESSSMDPFASLDELSKPIENSNTDFAVFDDILGSISEPQGKKAPISTPPIEPSMLDILDSLSEKSPSNPPPTQPQPRSNDIDTVISDPTGNQGPSLDLFDGFKPAAQGEKFKQTNTTNLLAKLANALGVPTSSFEGKSDQETIEITGTMVRTALQGIMEILQHREALKRELHLDATTFGHSENNPLKFSPSTRDTITRLYSSNNAYLSPTESIRDAVSDIQAHQMALLSGVQSALNNIIGEFNPIRLEEKLAKENPIMANIPIQKNAKLWELFEEHYAQLHQQASQDFERILQDNFVKSYEQHVKNIKKNRKG